MQYIFFWEGPFSNWYPATFVYKQLHFANSEQAFMWEKAVFFNDMETASQILNTPHPKQAKALGRQVKNFNVARWTQVKYQFMVQICYEKFIQNPTLLALLLAEPDKGFVEASPYDCEWGIGMYSNDPNINDATKWRGLNLLGKALNEVRNIIRVQ